MHERAPNNRQAIGLCSFPTSSSVATSLAFTSSSLEKRHSQRYMPVYFLENVALDPKIQDELGKWDSKTDKRKEHYAWNK